MIRRFLLPGIVFLGLPSVLLAPQTGWLARMQVKMTWLNQGEAEIKRLITPLKSVASTQAMEVAWELNTLCEEKLVWNRADLDRLVNTSVEEDKPLDIASGEEALRLCAIGERSDPNNAFFTLLRGAVLLGFHKDADALEALNQAAGKSCFEGYEKAAVIAGYRQLQTQKVQSLTDYTIPLRELLATQGMWGGELRGIFQGAMAHALKRQVTGDLKGAMEIRRDLRKLHDLLLREDIYATPRLVNIAQLSPLPLPIIVRGLSIEGPVEGAGVMERPVWMGPALPSKIRLVYYPAFLREHGYGEEALAFEKSLLFSKAKGAERQARREWEEENVNAMAQVHRNFFVIWGGLLLLASVITTLSCGILARILKFTQNVEVSKKARIGALLTFLLLVPLIGSACFGSADNTIGSWAERVFQPCYAAGDSEPEPWYADIVWALERWRDNLFEIAWILSRCCWRSL